jgi:hypothetical protein
MSGAITSFCQHDCGSVLVDACSEKTFFPGLRGNKIKVNRFFIIYSHYAINTVTVFFFTQVGLHSLGTLPELTRLIASNFRVNSLGDL